MRAGVAVFYPSLMGMINVHMPNVVVQATTDFGTACSELRHFIDATTLSELNGGASLMTSVVAPQPSVTKMMARGGGGQKILGMLSQPLLAQYTISDGRRVAMKLEEVLVIDNFPVPLHISMKRFVVGDKKREHGALHFMLNNLPGMIYCSAELPFKASSLPERFHQLPYWTGNSVFIGESDDAASEENIYDLLAARVGNADDLVKFVV